MKLYQVQQVTGTSRCDIEGRSEGYFLYEFSYGSTKKGLTFKPIDYDDLCSLFSSEEEAEIYVNNEDTERENWYLPEDNGIKLIGSIE